MSGSVLDDRRGEVTQRRSWQEVDHALRELARCRSALDADEARLLAIAVRDEIWRQVGAGSLHEYLETVLGYAPRPARERVRVARALADMPQLEDALATGVLHWSGARELARVATPANVERWLDRARGKTLREIEHLVAGHEKGDEPDDPVDPDLRKRRIAFELSPEMIALVRRAQQQLEAERGEPIDDDALIAATFRAYLEAGDTNDERSRARFQVMSVLCPSCTRAEHEAACRRYPIDETSRAIAECDAQWVSSEAPDRATQDIAPATRRFVQRRDGGKCCVPWCRASRHVDIHHVVARSEGGSHEADNLTLLCAGHHRALHDGKLAITGKAPALAVVRTVAPAVEATRVAATAACLLAGEDTTHVGCDAPDEHATELPRTTCAAPSRTRCIVPPDELERMRDVRLALTTLQFPKRVAEEAVEQARRELGPDATLERLVFTALRSVHRADT